MMGIKRLGCCLFLTLLTACGADKPAAMTDSGWKQYSSNFITSDGAVRDTGNNGISHSEGQGYAMLMAVAYGDEKAFRTLWQWTRSHLQIRDDYLFAWSWNPKDGVKDKNNASDGDLLIAWALYRAGRLWDDKEYTSLARNIVADIRRLLVKSVGDETILLPGLDGFQADDIWQLNPAYWVYPALEEIATATADPTWRALIASGKHLTAQASQGSWALPPDWIDYQPGKTPVVSATRPPRFGYEAVRVPLYMIWAGDYDESVVSNSARFWDTTSRTSFIPAWVDVLNGDRAEYEAPTGFKAVWKLTETALGQAGTADQAFIHADIKGQDYYSASLTMLSRIALQERFN
jgi:endoglucanase